MYYKINKKNVKLQAKIKNNQDKASDILQGKLLLFDLDLHSKEAEQASYMVGHPGEQIIDPMQEH
jgi:hypothetical protein